MPGSLSAPISLWALAIVAATIVAVTYFVLLAGREAAAAGKMAAPAGAAAGAAASPADGVTGAHGESFIRSWMAVTLVVGLLLLTVLSFGIMDTSLRSALVGGITASVGAAIAFYFSAKSADAARQDVLTAATQARSDILQATVGTDTVPNLVGMSLAEAKSALGTTTFKLNPSLYQEPDSTRGSVVPGKDDSVTKQDPPANSSAQVGTLVTVFFD